MKTLNHFFLFLALFFQVSCFSQSKNYEKDWADVDSLESKGLPKSALEIVNRIYRKASGEKNSPQIVKAMIYRMRLNESFEEDAQVKNIEEMEKECLSFTVPVSSILHSMLAEMYWNYFIRNRYMFYDRSKTANDTATDLRSWDLSRIAEKVSEHYKASLENSGLLKKINIEEFADILDNCNENNHQVRPVLYDFLIHRAIDFYMNDEAGLTLPVNEFNLKDEKYFLPVDAFSKLKIESADSTDFKFKAILLLQDAVRFHADDGTGEALIDVDLQRLDFVNKKSNSAAKDSLYLNSLYELRKRFEKQDVVGEVDFLIAQKLYDIGNNYNPLVSDLHKWFKKKALDECRESLAKDKTGLHNNSALVNLSKLEQQIEEKEIQITIEKENLPDEPFRALAAFKNSGKIYFNIYKTSDAELEKLKEEQKNSWDNKFLINHFIKKEVYLQFLVSMQDDSDCQEHSAEVKVPALPEGLYFILARTDSDGVMKQVVMNYGFTTVTNLSYILRQNTDGSDDLYVLNRKTGAPLPGALTECRETIYNYKNGSYKSQWVSSFNADENGYQHIPFKDLKREESGSNYYNYGYYFNFSYKGDSWSTMDYSDQYGLFNNYVYNNSKSEQARTYFFTDRSIYRPGQTIYFKGIVISTDGFKKNEIITGKNVSIRLLDVNWQEVDRLNLTTNEYGSFSGSFMAPANKLNGKMILQCDLNGSVQISVEEYKRPRFEVIFDTLHAAYKLGREIKIRGHAQTYSGAELDKALVSFRVVRETQFPWWYGFWWEKRPASRKKKFQMAK